MVHLVLFLVHGVDSGSGPELQQSLKQQSAQVHCKGEKSALCNANLDLWLCIT